MEIDYIALANLTVSSFSEIFIKRWDLLIMLSIVFFLAESGNNIYPSTRTFKLHKIFIIFWHIIFIIIFIKDKLLFNPIFQSIILCILGYDSHELLQSYHKKLIYEGIYSISNYLPQYLLLIVLAYFGIFKLHLASLYAHTVLIMFEISGCNIPRSLYGIDNPLKPLILLPVTSSTFFFVHSIRQSNQLCSSFVNSMDKIVKTPFSEIIMTFLPTSSETKLSSTLTSNGEDVKEPKNTLYIYAKFGIILTELFSFNNELLFGYKNLFPFLQDVFLIQLFIVLNYVIIFIILIVAFYKINLTWFTLYKNIKFFQFIYFIFTIPNFYKFNFTRLGSTWFNLAMVKFIIHLIRCQIFD